MNTSREKAIAMAKRNIEIGIVTSIQNATAGGHNGGVVNKATMRQFDAMCLTSIECLTSDEIRALRGRERVSQTVFALYLNVRKDSVSKWERGLKRPDGASLKLLNLVRVKGLHAIA
jgi:putative transcriptional regulator